MPKTLQQRVHDLLDSASSVAYDQFLRGSDEATRVKANLEASKLLTARPFTIKGQQRVGVLMAIPVTIILPKWHGAGKVDSEVLRQFICTAYPSLDDENLFADGMLVSRAELTTHVVDQYRLAGEAVARALNGNFTLGDYSPFEPGDIEPFGNMTMVRAVMTAIYVGQSIPDLSRVTPSQQTKVKLASMIGTAINADNYHVVIGDPCSLAELQGRGTSLDSFARVETMFAQFKGEVFTFTAVRVNTLTSCSYDVSVLVDVDQMGLGEVEFDANNLSMDLQHINKLAEKHDCATHFDYAVTLH